MFCDVSLSLSVINQLNLHYHRGFLDGVAVLTFFISFLNLTQRSGNQKKMFECPNVQPTVRNSEEITKYESVVPEFKLPERLPDNFLLWALSSKIGRAELNKSVFRILYGPYLCRRIKRYHQGHQSRGRRAVTVALLLQ